MEEYVWVSKLSDHSVFTSGVHPVLNRLATEYDVELTLAGPEDTSLEKYLQAIYDAIDRRVAGIMVVGWGDPEATDAINAAIGQGIPVVTVDSDVPQSKRLAHVGTDWFRMGGAMADDLASRIGGRGKVLMIGMTDLANMQTGTRGFKHRMAAYSNVELLGPENDLDVGYDRAQQIVDEYMKRYPDLVGVAGFDGNSGPGAAEAVDIAGKSGIIKIVCVDAEPIQIEYLRAGTISSLFAQKRPAFTSLAFQMLYSYNHGSAATGYRPGAINIPGNIDTGYVVVTTQNIDSYRVAFGHEDAYQRHDLSQRLALVSSMIENSSEIALAGDSERRLVYANRAAQKLFGLNEGSLSESSIESLFKLTDRQIGLLSDCVIHGKSARFEAPALLNDNSSIQYQVSVSPLYAGQLVRGLVVIASDVSNLKQVQNELRESEEKYSRLFNNLSDAIIVHDLRGNILDVNKKALETFGYSRDEMLTMKLRQLKPPEEFKKADAAFEEILKNGLIHFEMKFLKKNGDTFLAEVSSTLLNIGDKEIVQGVVRDISHRKHTEAALLESEERYRTFVQNFQGIAFRGKLDFTPIFLHGAVEEITGYTESEFLSGNPRWDQIVFPQDFEKASEIINQINTRPGYSAEVEYRIMHKSGAIRWIHMSIQNICDESGNPYRVQGAIYDVTGRKKAEEALRESEERFRVAFRTSPDAISITDVSTGKYVDINDGFTTLTGFTRDDVVGKTSVELEIWHDVADRNNMVATLLKQGYVKNFEARFRFKNGTVRTGMMSANIIQLLGESYILAVTRDIEDMKIAEEALRGSEERFRTIFEAAQDAIFIKDRDLKFVAVNPSLARMFKMTPEQFTGRTFEELFGTENTAIYRTNEQRVLNGEIVTSETNIMAGNVRRYLDIIIVPMRDPRGEVVGLCGIARDMTETRRLQEFAERAKRLEAAGRIAGQVAHDFNNLLGPLIAYPGLMREELAEDHPVIEYLDDLEKAAEQMAEINQQLLTLGRRGHYNLEPLNINDIIRTVVDRTQLNPADITIKTILEPEIMNVSGGSAQLYRAISNLMANACDALSAGGEITIKSENYYINSDAGQYNRIPRGEYVKVTISDTGNGIDDDIRLNIFDPFFTTKQANRKRGSGLGLSIVHAVVEDHNGYIDVDSRPGQGTSFYLYFPITRDQAEKVSSESIAGGNESILVVDDDPVQREVTSRLLNKLGYKIQTVESGEEAIKLLMKTPHDLLILDMIMSPGIDGAETYRRVLEINPGQKAIILSGFAESDKVKAAMKLGAGEFLRKPLTMKSLASAVRKGLDLKTKDSAGR